MISIGFPMPKTLSFAGVSAYSPEFHPNSPAATSSRGTPWEIIINKNSTIKSSKERA
jgi:hypothetical protein